MNEQRSRRPSLAIFLPALLGLAVAGGYYVGTRMNPVGGDAALFTLRKPTLGDKLQRVLDLIGRQYVDTVQVDHLVDQVLQDMLQQLDPHSYYISAADLQAAEEPLEGSFMGIGVEFSVQRDTIVVVATIEGGPSEKLGIRAGDRLISADGKPLAGVGIANDEVMKALRGAAGTVVAVGIVRNGAAPFNVDITRGAIPINSLAAALLGPDGIGYIKLSRFARTTHDEFLQAAKDLKAKGMTKLVLDLRGNGGGYLNAAIAICEELLPKGSEIVYTEGRTSPRQNYTSEGDGLLRDMPLAVLIDEGSASASEIVAGAMQDNDRGIIIGRRSFGKGLVQEHIELADHSAVRLTTARYYTPSGRCIQRPYGNGIDYNDAIEERYLHGELLNIDSIHLDTSLAYSTKSGRTVYGGGGIMPDLFVPADTADRSDYLSELFFSGALNRFAFDVADRHREQISQYGSPQAFVADYTISPLQLDKLANDAMSQGVQRNPGEMERSRSVIMMRLKAGIARNIWGDEGYYTVLLAHDPLFDKARDALQSTP